MGILIRQELFKLYKKKSTFILFGAVTLIMILIAITANSTSDFFDAENMFTSAFGAYCVMQNKSTEVCN
ncbi:hypothetical protein ACKXGF_02955 [Alkalibacillus sp. S2W]|uniref:hypothetical protein n=1 Tax=Alkalibacillus sp. S2W TaxID=3386553 RepID=UPI00398D201F